MLLLIPGAMRARLQRLQNQVRAQQWNDRSRRQDRLQRPERSLPWTRRNLRNRSSSGANHRRSYSGRATVGDNLPVIDLSSLRSETSNTRHLLDAFMSSSESERPRFPQPPHTSSSATTSVAHLTHRIQRFDLTKGIPSIIPSNENVVVRQCKLHNDATADISQDGRLLATFISTRRNYPDDTIVGVFSLEAGRLGDLLYTKGFGLFRHSLPCVQSTVFSLLILL